MLKLAFIFLNSHVTVLVTLSTTWSFRWCSLCRWWKRRACCTWSQNMPQTEKSLVSPPAIVMITYNGRNTPCGVTVRPMDLLRLATLAGHCSVAHVDDSTKRVVWCTSYNTMVHCVLLWYTVCYRGTLYYYGTLYTTVVQCTLLGYTVYCYGTLHTMVIHYTAIVGCILLQYTVYYCGT